MTQPRSCKLKQRRRRQRQLRQQSRRHGEKLVRRWSRLRRWHSQKRGKRRTRQHEPKPPQRSYQQRHALSRRTRHRRRRRLRRLRQRWRRRWRGHSGQTKRGATHCSIQHPHHRPTSPMPHRCSLARVLNPQSNLLHPTQCHRHHLLLHLDRAHRSSHLPWPPHPTRHPLLSRAKVSSPSPSTARRRRACARLIAH